MQLESLSPAAVEEIFERHGACSITLSDGGDDPVLEPGVGETPLWPNTCITALLPEDADTDSLRADLLSGLGLAELPAHRLERLGDRDWEREWLRDFRPMRFGRRLWVCPGEREVPAADAVVVRLDPGLAFGTGTHATTALCLEWLDTVELRGRTLLDVGCGSGVLAIAGLKLGCRAAAATDIDPQALLATRENARRNGVGGRLQLTEALADIDRSFDVVVANILAGPLIDMAGSIQARLAETGTLAMSGVLSSQVDDVLAAYEPWMRFDPPALREHDGQSWARLTGTRR